MSTFTPKTPEEGWEKRWPKQAFQLITQTPHLIMAFLGIFAGASLIQCLIFQDLTTIGKVVSETVFGDVLATLVFAPVIACWLHYLVRHEGYTKESFGGYAEAVKISFGTCLFLAMFFTALGFIAGFDSETTQSDNPLIYNVLTNIETGMGIAFIASYAGIFRLITVNMMGDAVAENEMASRKAHEAMKRVWPGFMFQITIAFLLTSSILPPYVTIPLFVFFIYILYVAGREIIGGIKGNKQADAQKNLAPVTG